MARIKNGLAQAVADICAGDASMPPGPKKAPVRPTPRKRDEHAANGLYSGSTDGAYGRRAQAPPEHVLLTVPQIEEKHPALKGRMRTWIHRADCGDPEFAWLRIAVVRIGRSVFVSDE